MAVAFGGDPALTYAATAPLPDGIDEWMFAGFLRGKSVEHVKCKTVDLEVPACADFVLEGYVDPKDRRYETKESEDAGIQGRFHFHPEWAGYMGKAYKAPTFHVTAVTMRKPQGKPIIFALGVHTLDDHNIDTTVRAFTRRIGAPCTAPAIPISSQPCGRIA